MKKNKNQQFDANQYREYLNMTSEAIELIFAQVHKGEHLEKNLKLTSELLVGLEEIKDYFEVNSYCYNTLIYLEVVMLRTKITAMERLAINKE